MPAPILFAHAPYLGVLSLGRFELRVQRGTLLVMMRDGTADALVQLVLDRHRTLPDDIAVVVASLD